MTIFQCDGIRSEVNVEFMWPQIKIELIKTVDSRLLRVVNTIKQIPAELIVSSHLALDKSMISPLNILPEHHNASNPSKLTKIISLKNSSSVCFFLIIKLKSGVQITI